METDLDMTSMIIESCARLHNYCIDKRLGRNNNDNDPIVMPVNERQPVDYVHPTWYVNSLDSGNAYAFCETEPNTTMQGISARRSLMVQEIKNDNSLKRPDCNLRRNCRTNTVDNTPRDN